MGGIEKAPSARRWWARGVAAVKWSAGAVLGLLGLATAAATLFLCAEFAFEPSTRDLSRLQVITLAYVLAFLSVLLAIYSVRLIVPRWRVEGGRVIGSWSMKVVAGLYLAMIATAAIFDPEEVKLRLTVMLLGVLVVLAFRATFGRRGGHGR